MDLVNACSPLAFLEKIGIPVSRKLGKPLQVLVLEVHMIETISTLVSVQ